MIKKICTKLCAHSVAYSIKRLQLQCNLFILQLICVTCVKRNQPLMGLLLHRVVITIGGGGAVLKRGLFSHSAVKALVFHISLLGRKLASKLEKFYL